MDKGLWIDSFVLRLGKIPSNIAHYMWGDLTRRNCLVYWLLLWFSISHIVTFSQGFNFTPQPIIYIPIQGFLIILIAKLLPTEVSGPIEVLQILTAIFLTIPTITLAHSNILNIEFQYGRLALIYVLINQYVLSILSGNKSRLNFMIRRPSISILGIAILLIIILLVCILLSIRSGIPNLSFVSFSELYNKRSELTTNLSQSKLWYLPYALGWVGGVIIPILFCFGISMRNYLLLICCCFLFIFSYLLTSQKWILASFFLVVFFKLIERFNASKVIRTVNVFRGVNSIIILLIALQTFIQRFPWMDMGVRRALLDPSIMLQYYVKFSSDYPMQWWADSNISRMFSNTDPMPVPRIIGDRYFNIPSRFIFPRPGSSNATAGSLADSIAQGGIIGLLITTLAVLGFFYLLNVLAVGRNRSIVFILSGLAVEMLVEGPLHTLLLSRGLIIIPIVLFLLPYESTKDLSKK